MAGKRFFAGMNPHVILQVGIRPCMKITHMAGVRFGVRFGGNFLILKQYRVYLIVSNHQLWYFSPLFPKNFLEKTIWINDTFIYQSFWKNSYILGSILWTFRRWAFKLEDWLQRYWHKWQANGFSPVWILMWICKLAYLLVQNLHKWQAWGFKSNLLWGTFGCWNNNKPHWSIEIKLNQISDLLPFFSNNILLCKVIVEIELYSRFNLVDIS